VAEALREIAGATLVQSGPMGQLTSLFLRGGNAQYNKVLIDGIPVNEPGGAYNFANLSSSNIERIEVVRGPQSALFGSDAVPEWVQIFTVGNQRGVVSRTGTFGWREEISAPSAMAGASREAATDWTTRSRFRAWIRTTRYERCLQRGNIKREPRLRDFRENRIARRIPPARPVARDTRSLGF